MDCKRICELPDFLRTLILTFVPTKDSVRSSVLSKRWQFLWLSVPALHLRANDLPRYDEVIPSFMEKYLEFNQESRMQKFKIVFDLYNTNLNRFIEWITRAVDLGIQHLDVWAFLFLTYKPLMPMNIYNSNRLVSLKLVTVALRNPELTVSLPCLKIIHLEEVLFHGGSIIMEKLISGSSALEDLTLITSHDNYRTEAPLFLCVRSQTLKRFCFKFRKNLVPDLGHDCSVEIDAPRLEYLNFVDDQSERIVMKNLSSLVKLDIDSNFNVGLLPLGLSKRDTIRDFLTRISSVRHMIISPITLKILYEFARFERIQKFNNLSSFHVMLSGSFLRLSLFLECCPNLKHFILDVSCSLEPEEAGLIYVPQCFLWTLECVEIKGVMIEEETWKKLARYFLESSGALKKLVLRFRYTPTTKQASDIFMGLLPISMSSRMCRIIIY